MIKGTGKYSIVIISFDTIYSDIEGVAPQVYLIEEKRLAEVKDLCTLVNEIFHSGIPDDRCPDEIFNELLQEKQIEYSYIGYVETEQNHMEYEQYADKVEQFDI